MSEPKIMTRAANRIRFRDVDMDFSVGAASPLLVVPFASQAWIVPLVAVVSIACLALLGVLGAGAGGAPVTRSVFRVTFWGILAMILTAGIRKLFGTVV